MELVEAIRSRRSVRKYKGDPIPQETVRELLELAAWAPSGMNSQPWLFVVVAGRKYLRKLSDRARSFLLERMAETPALETYRIALSDPDFNIFYGAPVLVLIYGNTKAFTYVHDCSMAALNLMLTAWDRGIGSCWIGFARSFCGTAEIKTELKVPAEFEPVAPVILGYPADPPGRAVREEIRVIYHQK